MPWYVGYSPGSDHGDSKGNATRNREYNAEHPYINRQRFTHWKIKQIVILTVGCIQY